MRASEAVSRIPSEVLQAFMGRLPESIRSRVVLLQNPTNELRDELVDAKATGKGWGDVKLFANSVRVRRRGSSGKARVEENYFYSSRRFPALANNTIGSGALVAQTYPYFTKGAGDNGDSLGFPTGFVLGPPETNLEQGGTIPQGTDFVFQQLGVSFNSDIAVEDLADMLDCAALGFSKSGGQFSLNQGPLKMWPAGMGISGAFGVSGNGDDVINRSAVTNGVPNVKALRTLSIPRVLRAQEAFKYSVHIERATKATNGATIGLSDFVIPTIWLFGAQRNEISG